MYICIYIKLDTRTTENNKTEATTYIYRCIYIYIYAKANKSEEELGLSPGLLCCCCMQAAPREASECMSLCMHLVVYLFKMN